MQDQYLLVIIRGLYCVAGPSHTLPLTLSSDLVQIYQFLKKTSLLVHINFVLISFYIRFDMIFNQNFNNDNLLNSYIE